MSEALSKKAGPGGKLNFHSVRHTAARARRSGAGANIPGVAAMLGHYVTLTVYADAWRAKAEHSAEALAGVLFGNTCSSLVARPKLQVPAALQLVETGAKVNWLIARRKAGW